MPTITVDESTYRAIELAARLTGMSQGDVVARLVDQANLSTQNEVPAAAGESTDERVPIYADYDGHRTHALFDRTTSRIDIIDGPLTGRHFKTPSSAARAVVEHYRPIVNPNRNGWSFWVIDDGHGRFLQQLRRRS
jgi:hypothetical protein